MNPNIIKLDAQGNILPADSTDHAILQINGLNIDVRKRTPKAWAGAMAEAKAVDLLGLTWRNATVKEIFALTDLERFEPAFDKSLFPHFPDFGVVWSSTEDASEKESSSPDCAWGVYLYDGDAYFNGRRYEGLALPVSPLAAPASQS